MKRIQSHSLGIDQGDVVLFSDFENDGDMWTGHGDRERRQSVTFSQAFRRAPAVQVALSLYDMDTTPNIRAEISAENITESGFELVFRTWADSKIARVRIGWTAFGELPYEDDWSVLET